MIVCYRAISWDFPTLDEKGRRRKEVNFENCFA